MKKIKKINLPQEWREEMRNFMLFQEQCFLLWMVAFAGLFLLIGFVGLFKEGTHGG